jgi:hypothetical protein
LPVAPATQTFRAKTHPIALSQSARLKLPCREPGIVHPDSVDFVQHRNSTCVVKGQQPIGNKSTLRRPKYPTIGRFSPYSWGKRLFRASRRNSGTQLAD